jgi:hypothetical protein
LPKDSSFNVLDRVGQLELMKIITIGGQELNVEDINSNKTTQQHQTAAAAAADSSSSTAGSSPSLATRKL